jgi:hypothetical protein
MRTLFRLTSFVGLGFVLIAPTRLIAQGCGSGDDQFSAVPCCTPAQGGLPAFPGFQVSAEYACFKDCGLEATFPIRVSTTHIPVLCDIDIIQILVSPGTAASPGLNGLLAAKYARTWTESTGVPGTPPRQVWRFLINGDLTYTSGAAPCPVPPHPAGATTNFHGHVDYACQTDAAGVTSFRMALSLHHLQGCIEHNLFSCSPLPPGPAHDDRSYHIVAPAGFVWGAAPIVAGPIQGESVRSATFLPTYQCFGESRLNSNSIVPGPTDCLCVPVGTPVNPVIHDTITGTAFCGTGMFPFASVPVPPPLPPLTTGTTQLPIGTWTLAPGNFPGNRQLVAHWGLLNYTDPCNTAHPPFHFVQGVSTSGVPATPFGAPGTPINTLLDLQDMISPTALLGMPVQPRWGCLYVSKLVFNLNL